MDVRKAAEIPEGKGDREGAFSLAASPPTRRLRQPTHPSPSKHRGSTGSTEQSSSQSAQCTQKEGTAMAAAGGGRPADWIVRVGCGRFVVVSEQWLKRLSLDRIIHASHASPPRLCTVVCMYHHPLLPAHTTQHIRSRHAIAQLSTCPRPNRFASSTRWVLPFNIYHAIMPSCGDASSSASHSTFQRPAVSNKPP